MEKNNTRITSNEELSGLENNLKSILESIVSYPVLELLIISEDKSYRDIGKDYFSRQVTPIGSTLFDVTTATRKQLSNSLENGVENYNKTSNTQNGINYFSDVLLFDLRKKLDDGLKLLSDYLRLFPECYVVASHSENKTDDLLKNPTWKNLRERKAKYVLRELTKREDMYLGSYLFERPDYVAHFRLLHSEHFSQNNLTIVGDLKSGWYDKLWDVNFKYYLRELILHSHS